MKTINETAEQEIKSWLDKNIAPELRNSSEVVTLSKEAIEKVTHRCERNAGYNFGCSDAVIIDSVNSYFINYFYS